MAKRMSPEIPETNAAPESTDGRAPKSGPVSGYFRDLFTASPEFLEGRSNEKILERWLADHPGETEVPKPVRSSLANMKSIMRSKTRKSTARKQKNGNESGTKPVSQSVAVRALEKLEQQIDECLTIARHQDREGLDSVINLLRRARNAVVWKIGQ
jgi:hypothetical protein